MLPFHWRRCKNHRRWMPRRLRPRGGWGRYEIHELLRQYAAELLEAEPEAYTAARDAYNVDPAFGLRSE